MKVESGIVCVTGDGKWLSTRRGEAIAIAPDAFGAPSSYLRPGVRVLFIRDDATSVAGTVVIDLRNPAQREEILQLWRTRPPREPDPIAPAVDPSQDLSHHPTERGREPAEGSRTREAAVHPGCPGRDVDRDAPARRDPVSALVEHLARAKTGEVSHAIARAITDGQRYHISARQLKSVREPEVGLRIVLLPSPDRQCHHVYGSARVLKVDHETTYPLDTEIITQLRQARGVDGVLRVQSSVKSWAPGYLNRDVVLAFVALYQEQIRDLDAGNHRAWSAAMCEFVAHTGARGKETRQKILATYANLLWQAYFISSDLVYLKLLAEERESRSNLVAVKVAVECLEHESYRRIIERICSPRSGLGIPIVALKSRFHGVLPLEQAPCSGDGFIAAVRRASSGEATSFRIVTRLIPEEVSTDPFDVPSLQLAFVGPDASAREVARVESARREDGARIVLLHDLDEVTFRASWRSALLDHLRKTQGIYNMVPVRGRAFFGRHHVLRELSATICQTGFFLAGIRKVGKTSVAHKLMQRARDGYELRLSPWNDTSRDPAAESLRLRRIVGTPSSRNTEDVHDYAAIREIFASPKLSPAHAVLFVDEMGAFFRRAPRVDEPLVVHRSASGFVLNLFSWLRELAEERRVALVAAGVTPGPTLDQHFQDSDGAILENPLFGVLNVQHIRGLDPAETAEMVAWFAERHFVTCEDGVAARIHQLSGGIPVFSRLILNLLIDDKPRPQVLGVEDVDGFDWNAAASRPEYGFMKSNLSRHLAEIDSSVHGLSVVNVLRAAMHRDDGCISWAELTGMFGDGSELEDALKLLEDYGYVRVDAGRKVELNCRILARLPLA